MPAADLRAVLLAVIADCVKAVVAAFVLLSLADGAVAVMTGCAENVCACVHVFACVRRAVLFAVIADCVKAVVAAFVLLSLADGAVAVMTGCAENVCACVHVFACVNRLV